MGVAGHKLLMLAMEFPPAAVGTATYAHRLATCMVGQGVEVLVLAPKQKGDRAFDRGQPYQVKRMALSRFVPWQYAVAQYWVRKTLYQFSPHSLWTTNGMATRTVGAMGGLGQFKVPLVACMRGSDVTLRLPGSGLWQRLESRVQLRCYRWAAAIAASSEFVKGVAVRKGIEGGKIFVNYPAFDFAALVEKSADSQLARKTYPFVKHRPVVLSVGRLVKQKRFDIAIAAIAQVKRQVPDVCHVVVGEGPERQRLNKMAAELGLEGTVHFTGHLPAMSPALYGLYSCARVFVLPSVGEGLGNVFVEASAFGLPSVGCASGGVPEVVVDGETGLLAAPDDIGGVAERIEQVLANQALGEQLGQRAHQRIATMFSMEAMSKRSLKVLAALDSRMPSGETQVAVIGKED